MTMFGAVWRNTPVFTYTKCLFIIPIVTELR